MPGRVGPTRNQEERGMVDERYSIGAYGGSDYQGRYPHITGRPIQSVGSVITTTEVVVLLGLIGLGFLWYQGTKTGIKFVGQHPEIVTAAMKGAAFL